MNFSYSSIDDVYATMQESQDPNEKKILQSFASDLEASGMGVYNGTTYILRPTRWGMEIVSEDDLESESEEDY